MEVQMSRVSEEDMKDLFGDYSPTKEEETPQNEENVEDKEIKNEPIADESKTQESGSNEGKQNNIAPSKSAEDSPNFFTSIAKALKEEGIFPDLNFDDVKDAGSFKRMFETQVDNRLDERQKMIAKALDAGVDTDELKTIDGNISLLEGLSERDITANTAQGEEIRKHLIYADLINKGFSDERARKTVEKLIESGNDIEEAKEAYKAVKQYWFDVKDSTLKKAEDEKKQFIENRKKSFEELKKSIEDKEMAFDAIKLDPETKKKIYENVTKATYKSPNGEFLTALGKFETENRKDFLRIVGTFFTLTDGFTDFSKFFKPVANNATKKGIAELEDVLKGKKAPDSGNITMMGNHGSNAVDDFFSSNWTVSKD